MKTKIVKKNEPQTETLVINSIKKNRIVIIKCDTIYGIIGKVGSTQKKIEKLKKRKEKKFLQLIPNANIENFSRTKIPQSFLKFWPGPLTLIVEDLKNSTVAVRFPKDEFLLKVMNSLNCNLYSTSVNISGEPALNNFDEILKKFNGKVSLIVDCGNFENSKPSTIVDITKKSPKLIREGAIEKEKLPISII